jgi:sugar lactone lactonase YvrE
MPNPMTGGKTRTRPISLAFDTAGTLWVSNSGDGQIVSYNIDHTAATASPDAVLTPSLADNTTNMLPDGLAFDNAGDLWVVDSTSDALLKYEV